MNCIQLIRLGGPDQRKKKKNKDNNQYQEWKGNIAVDSSNIKQIREYYVWLCIIAFENLDEMDAFLENYEFPKMKQKTENLLMLMWLFS